MSNVIPIGGITRLDLPADRVLEGAIGQMKGVVLIGFDQDGNEYFASTYAGRRHRDVAARTLQSCN